MSIQSRSWVQIADNSGIKKIRVFHTYRWGYNKKGLSGYYFYGSIRKHSQAINLRRGKKRIRRGQKVRGLLIRNRQYQYRFDGSRVKSWDNAGIILKNVFKTKGTRFVGPICKDTYRPRYYTLFKAIV